MNKKFIPDEKFDKKLKKLFHSDKTLRQICKKLNISKIVVNNLVGYANSLNILDFVSKIKRNSHVSFRGHDFQSLCPCFTLIDCDGNFCNFKHNLPPR